MNNGTPGDTSDDFCRSGEDVISINGDWSVNGGIYTDTGEDIVIIGGNLGRTGAPYIDLGRGNDRAYINSINNACTTAEGTCEPRIYGGLGIDEIYFDAADGNATSGVSPTIYGGDNVTAGDGDDIIACVGAITGSCGMGTSTRLINIFGEDGNDRILIDASLSSNTAVTRNFHGGKGNNIIYVKGKSGTITLNTCLTASDAACTTSTGSGNSLMIVGGNYSGNGYVKATGSNNVLLIKTGSSVTSTSSGFARTLYY